jgi:predicted Zn-dependent peptidase
MKIQYSAPKIVIAAAGNVEHNYIVDLAEKAFCDLPHKLNTDYEPIKYQGGDYREIRDLEQVHIVMGLDGVSYKDPDYYSMSVLSTLLGGGMSSRLFQEVREKRGLVYSIYSFASCFEDGGIFGIYAGTGKDEVGELLPIICFELQKLADKIDDDEVARARSQLKAATLMALESTTSRSEQVARQLQIFGRIVPVEEIINQIENVSVSALKRTTKRLLQSELTIAAIGQIQNVEEFSAIKKRLN